MQITQKENEVLVQFGNKLNSKVKILFMFLSLNGFIFCITGIFILMSTSGALIARMVFGIILILLGIIIAWRFINRISEKEDLLISDSALTLSNKTLVRDVQSEYPLEEISNLHYRGRDKKTPHPLKGGVYDYFGFETQELAISEVFDEGNISFTCEGRIIRFGRNIYSWDAEKLNEIFARVTHNKLTIANLTEEISDDEAGTDNINTTEIAPFLG